MRFSPLSIHGGGHVQLEARRFVCVPPEASGVAAASPPGALGGGRGGGAAGGHAPARRHTHAHRDSNNNMEQITQQTHDTAVRQAGQRETAGARLHAPSQHGFARPLPLLPPRTRRIAVGKVFPHKNCGTAEAEQRGQGPGRRRRKPPRNRGRRRAFADAHTAAAPARAAHSGGAQTPASSTTVLGGKGGLGLGHGRLRGGGRTRKQFNQRLVGRAGAHTAAGWRRSAPPQNVTHSRKQPRGGAGRARARRGRRGRRPEPRLGCHVPCFLGPQVSGRLFWDNFVWEDFPLTAQHARRYDALCQHCTGPRRRHEARTHTHSQASNTSHICYFSCVGACGDCGKGGVGMGLSAGGGERGTGAVGRGGTASDPTTPHRASGHTTPTTLPSIIRRGSCECVYMGGAQPRNAYNGRKQSQ